SLFLPSCQDVVGRGVTLHFAKRITSASKVFFTALASVTDFGICQFSESIGAQQQEFSSCRV
ncbi:MAG: hypothetical protein RL092_1578, partial [Bacteroidota bacterium]